MKILNRFGVVSLILLIFTVPPCLGENYQTYIKLGEADIANRDFDNAVSHFTKAIEVSPEDAARDGVYTFRGKLYFLKGQHQLAISDLNIAIMKDPQDPENHYIRGAICGKQGMYAKAFSDYTRAIEIDPEIPDPYNDKAWLLATCPDAAYRNGAEAVKLAKRAVALETNVIFLDTLAAAYAEAGQFDRAIATQQKVIENLKKGGEEQTLVNIRSVVDIHNQDGTDNAFWVDEVAEMAPVCVRGQTPPLYRMTGLCLEAISKKSFGPNSLLGARFPA